MTYILQTCLNIKVQLQNKKKLAISILSVFFHQKYFFNIQGSLLLIKLRVSISWFYMANCYQVEGQIVILRTFVRYMSLMSSNFQLKNGTIPSILLIVWFSSLLRGRRCLWRNANVRQMLSAHDQGVVRVLYCDAGHRI